MPTLTFKATAAEARAIRAAARRRRQNVSAYLRQAALAAAGPAVPKPRLVRSRKTGALVVAAPPGAPPLTDAEIRAALADFP